MKSQQAFYSAAVGKDEYLSLLVGRSILNRIQHGQKSGPLECLHPSSV